MSLSSIKRLIARSNALKRLAARTLAAIPALDLWARNRIGAEAYRPSGLQIGERQLPEAAAGIYARLLAAVEADRRP